MAFRAGRGERLVVKQNLLHRNNSELTDIGEKGGRKRMALF